MVIRRKISLIGILMAASWLLLCLFVSQWIGSQYRAEKKQLRQEISLSLQQTKDRISDSIANTVVQSMLEKANAPTSMKANIALSAGNKVHIATQILTAQSHFPKSPIIAPGNTPRIEKRPDSFEFTNMADSQKIKLILKGILRRIMSDTGAHVSISGKVDLALYRRSVQTALTKKHLALMDSSTALKHSDSDFVFRLTDPDMVFPVGGIQPYILKKLVPQIAFSVTLLLLVGLAFLMSYMNLRKQLRFNEQKDMFIANVSHELKTPVATAKVAIEALQQHDAIHHPERAERYLGIAGWELERLQTMMEKIMNSLPENEKEVTIQEARTDIRPILFRLADIIQSMQKEPTVTFFWALPGTPVHISADELHFTNIIYNLLDNAVKYGGTEIHIAVDVDADNVTIKISDNGPGIPAEYRNKVFDRFFRIPSGNRHNVKGYGLGLSYVKQMVEAHKGTIRLATGPVTCFIIKWPKFKG